MYRCDNCNAVSQPSDKQHRVVVATRSHQFPYRAEAHRFRREGKIETQDDPGGVGTQIVREVGVCAPCRRLIEGNL